MAKKLKSKKVLEESMGETSDVQKVRRLEELLNVKGQNPFGTEDPELFEQKLDEMTIADLQRLCYDVGLRPMTNRIDLKKQLSAEFTRNHRSLKNGFASAPIPKVDEKDPSYGRLMKLING